jgi:polyisoprenoid-binding protein YceI
MQNKVGMERAKWVIDQAYSEIGFRVKNKGFSNVSGKLSKFNALIAENVDVFSDAIIEFDGQIDKMSIHNTGLHSHCKDCHNSDGPLPDIMFEAATIKRIDEVNYQVTGNLNWDGIIKPITLDTEFSGLLRDPWGSIKAGFLMRATIDSGHWKLSSIRSMKLPLREEIRLNIGIQFVKK